MGTDKQFQPLYPKANDLFGASRPVVLIGYVIDIVPGPRFYKVDVDGKTIPCIDANGTGGCHMFGARRLGYFQLGSRVVVVKHKGSAAGIIIGGLPSQVGATSMNVTDHVHGYTGSSAYNDIAEYYPLQLPEAGGVLDYSNNRPVDATPGSDSGEINELGVGYGVSRLYSWIRASELAGLWCFYPDNMVRLAAYNFEMWTAGSERTVYNDSGEINDVEMSTPFHWEALGLLDPGTAAMVENPEGGWFKPGQNKPWYSPIREDQTMLPRRIRLGGYLGDSLREMVVVPEADKVGTPETLSNQSALTGVLDIQQHADGLLAMRSARGIIMEKYIFLPVPKAIAKPEEAKDSSSGDSVKNYAAAGVAWGDISGKVEPHKKKSWRMPGEEGGDPAYSWAAAAFDAHGYLLNELSNRAITAHKKDFYLPEEGDESVGAGNNEAAYTFMSSTLEEAFVLPLPRFTELKVDHRFEEDKPRYYFSRSAIEQMPDGSILIEDGYGSSIFMSGGNIYLSCPGDVWATPGRSFVTWAGDDVVAKAGQSVDITASHKDVRIKAERNMHVLSGNSKKVGGGGILLESRSKEAAYDFLDKYGEDVTSSGIVLKAADSPVRVYGSAVYAESTAAVGDITLNAGKGVRRDISKLHVRWVSETALDILGLVPSEDTEVNLDADPDTGEASGTSINVFTPTRTILGGSDAMVVRAASVVISPRNSTDEKKTANVLVGGDLSLTGNVAIDGRVAMKGSIRADGDMVCRGLNVAKNHASMSGVVAKILELPEPLELDVEKVLTDNEPTIQAVEANTVAPEEIKVDAIYYGDSAPGNVDFKKALGFTCRTEEQYRLEEGDFMLAESRWQQWYRVGGSGNKWVEPKVDSPWDGGLPTQPHPGYTLWESDEGIAVYDAEIWSWDELKNGARSATPKNKAAEMKKKALKDGYLITVQHEE